MRSRERITIIGVIVLLIGVLGSHQTIAQTSTTGTHVPWDKLHKKIEVTFPDSLKTEFEKFVIKHQLKLNAKQCNDGKYTALSIPDDYGYQHVVMIEIKEGKIIQIHYDEANPDALSKRNDKEYNEAMSITGATPNKAYDKYEFQLLEKQDLSKIDVVSGATYSLYRFNKTVAKALDVAKKKD
ncbi:FMN-binding protein [Prolixibacteraceae bacterium JC049]|nr:FMN-binding protein [Prolixibacteraceae bacterium JC049]